MVGPSGGQSITGARRRRRGAAVMAPLPPPPEPDPPAPAGQVEPGAEHHPRHGRRDQRELDPDALGRRPEHEDRIRGIDEEAPGHQQHARHEPAPPAMPGRRLAVAVVVMRMRSARGRRSPRHPGRAGAARGRAIRAGPRSQGPRARDAAVAADPEHVVHRGGMVACARAAAAAGKRGPRWRRRRFWLLTLSRSTSRRLARSSCPTGRPRSRGSRISWPGPARGPAGRPHRPREPAPEPDDVRARQPGARDPSGRATGARGAGSDQASARLVHQHRARGAPPAARHRAGHRLGLHDPDVLRHDRARGGASRVQGPHGRRRHGRDGGQGPGRQVIPADQVHRTHLGSLNGFLATVTTSGALIGAAPGA